MNGVIEIDYDAIVILLSIMVRFKAQKIDFNGDMPLNPLAKQRLMDSGFFDNLYKHFKDEDRYNLVWNRRNSFYTHAWKNVDSELTGKVIDQASQTVWGELRRCPGMQRILIEIMQNTNNHAALGKEGDKHWWLSVNHRKNENKVCFSFVDYGVGVFRSLQEKEPGSKFYLGLDKLAKRFTFQDNAALLKLIFNGELHKSSTGEHFRGKGLPGIYEALQRNSISNLYIVTNDVYAAVSQNIYRTMNSHFEGTFLYWELNKTNESYDGTY